MTLALYSGCTWERLSVFGVNPHQQQVFAPDRLIQDQPRSQQVSTQSLSKHFTCRPWPRLLSVIVSIPRLTELRSIGNSDSLGRSQLCIHPKHVALLAPDACSALYATLLCGAYSSCRADYTCFRQATLGEYASHKQPAC